ncbi:MAG: hypothetical protein AB7P76_02170 [Candidatus Melainabacteria bacterium]
MSYLCLTLPEAAKALDMTETVLVRLSQYFRVPEDAYDSIGTLSFRGDLKFSDPDLTFFRQVKHCIVAGETLDQIKERLKPKAAPAAETNLPARESPEFIQALNTLYSEEPAEQVAEDTLARYKHQHHPQPSPAVFESLAEDMAQPEACLTPPVLPAPQQPPMPQPARTSRFEETSWQIGPASERRYSRPSLQHAGLRQAARTLRDQFIRTP